MIRSLQDIFTTSRSRILSQLKARPHTISELSRITGYSKPTLAYHLDKLCESGMVKRVENGRKWVYYELTEKGRKLIKQDTALLVSFILAAFASAILAAFRFVRKSQIYGVERAPAPLKPLETPAVKEIPSVTPSPAPIPTPTPTPTPAPTPTPMPTAPPLKVAPAPDYLAITLLVIASAMVLLFLLYRRR